MGVPEITVTGLSAGKSVSILGASVLFLDPLAPVVRVQSNLGAVRFSSLDISLGSIGNCVHEAVIGRRGATSTSGA